MARRTATVAFKPRVVTVSGATYQAAKLNLFPLKHFGTRKTGFGIQYKFNVLDLKTFRRLEDLLAEAACDTADVEGDSCPTVLAIYKDLGRMAHSG